MAKNDAHATTVKMSGPTQVATPARKDTSLLQDGTWYVTVPCPHHGTDSGHVDEEVSWAEAKTPHHAGVIADRRHATCARASEIARLIEAARVEIEAADHLLDDQLANLARVEQEHAPLRKVGGHALRIATEQLLKHRDGITHAQRRAQETRAQNEARIAALQQELRQERRQP